MIGRLNLLALLNSLNIFAMDMIYYVLFTFLLGGGVCLQFFPLHLKLSCVDLGSLFIFFPGELSLWVVFVILLAVVAYFMKNQGIQLGVTVLKIFKSL